jgi:mitofusin
VLSEEICNLSVLVDEFNLPFKPEQHALNEYKRELHHHVENGLGSKIHARLSNALAKNIANIQQEMTGNK